MHRPSQKLIMFGRKRQSSSASQNEVSTSAGGGATTSSQHSPVLIQKFIVLHEGLMPLHNNNENDDDHTQQRRQRRNPQSMLSEDASLEEHGEFILYYYDHALNAPHNGGRRSRPPVVDYDTDKNSDDFSFGPEEETTSHASEDAVRFAGLCRALRSLPMALRPQKCDNSVNDDTKVDEHIEVAETEVVHLSASTLVFIPLELDGDVVAIAQLPRAINRCNQQRHSPGNQSTTLSGCNLQSNLGYGADPSAIQETIQQIHSLFALMHGGGIHRRLLRTRHLEQSKDWVVEIDNVNDSTKGSEKIASGQDMRRNSQERISTKLSSNNKQDGFYQDSNGPARRSSSEHNQLLQYYRYGGMKELFDLRREYREIQNKQREEKCSSSVNGIRKSAIWGSSVNAEDLFAGIANELGHHDCLNRIEKLLQVLPITTLREDLECFYDEWLWRMQGVCDIMKGGVGRCVVEMVPAPLFSFQSSLVRDVPVRGQHPPQAPQPFVCLAGAEFIKTLISDEVPHLNGKRGLQFSRLLGMSFFYQNQFVHSKMIGPNENEMKDVFPPEMSCIIADHFYTFSQREAERSYIAELTKQASELRDNNVSPSNHNALERWVSTLSLNSDEKGNLSPPAPTPMEALSGFAQPPAASDRNNDGQLPSLFVPELNRQVWLPNLHPPCPKASQIIEHDESIETHVAMFGKGDFTFLLFFELHDPYGGGSILEQMAEEMNPDEGSQEGRLIVGDAIKEEAKAFATLLTFLDAQISEFCTTYSARDSADSGSNAMAPVKEINSHRLFQGEAGMNIIYIKRNENSFVLLSQYDLSSNQFKRVETNEPVTNVPKPKSLFGFVQKTKQEENRTQFRSRQPTHHKDILDCRHKLAAHLPLDVMLAFDDMFNEVGRLSSRRRNLLSPSNHHFVAQPNTTSDSSSSKVIELCTFLPQGWVYCHADGEQELYILLDTSKFVTIADVQKAVVKVRDRITSWP